MTIAMQDSFLQEHPVASGNLRDKARYILTEYPEARESYKLAIYHFWMDFDGLDLILGNRAEAFKAWFEDRATSPQTLRNRCQEVQNWLPQLDASPEVEQQRQRQATQGPVL